MAQKDESSDTVPVFAVTQARTTRGGDSATWTDAKTVDLLNSFKSVSDAISKMLHETAEQPAGFQMKKIEVKLGVSAKGQVGFLGTGAEAGAEGSITVTFER